MHMKFDENEKAGNAERDQTGSPIVAYRSCIHMYG